MGAGASVSQGSTTNAINQEMSMPTSSSYTPSYSCRRYSFSEIEEATNSFENMIGKGGEGEVYKGVTRENIPVAVKRLKPGRRSSEFEKEIQMLSDLHHPNLVSLVGYCHEADKKIMIYEFMSKGNLDQNLYGRTRDDSPLSWKQRLNICIGAGKGLRCLHTPTNMSPEGIVHRDVKPANILLDENFIAKISDFGLAEMGPLDQTNFAVKGTRGYCAPETHGQISSKIDVYAFGKVMFELLCKKKPRDLEESFNHTENDQKYGKWAKVNVDPDLEMEIIVPGCSEAYAFLMEKCLNSDPTRRPSMNHVVLELESLLEWQEEWERAGFSSEHVFNRSHVAGSFYGNQEQLMGLLNNKETRRDKLKVRGRDIWRKQKIFLFRLRKKLGRGRFKKQCLLIYRVFLYTLNVIVFIVQLMFTFMFVLV